jgi:hypothetical protein
METTMLRSLHPLPAIGSAVALALLAACATDASTSPDALQPGGAVANRAGYDVPGMHRQFGPPVKVGDGMARTYVVLDAKSGQRPVELGFALDARALDGLPSDAMHAFFLQLPQKAPEPYQFAELDWNPMGHPPAGVYTVPHFDFHLYVIPRSEVDAIVPSDPEYATKARNLPTDGFVPPGYLVPGDPAEQAVPMMGVHWFDSSAPELQNLFNNPAGYQPFTRTFIYGSWDGRFTFYEPMVTRAYLQTKPNVVAPISVPSLYSQAGWYPTAYRVSYDAKARTYYVALTGLVERSATPPAAG